MNKLTCVFLVLLRLSIGWHFFFEGWEKIQSPSWSSEAYLRESQGPLAPQFRDLAGDRVLEQLTLQALPDGANAETTPPSSRFPPALAREWDAYLNRFKRHYELDTKPATPDQPGQLEKTYQQAKDTTATWLANGKVTVVVESPLAPTARAEVEQTIPERLAAYRARLAEVRRLEEQERRDFGGQVNTDIAAAKAEANKIRGELAAGLRRQTESMKDALKSVLTPEQKEVKDMDDVPPQGYDRPSVFANFWKHLAAWGQFGSMTPLERSDLFIRWGVYLVGACLLAGFLTRTACVGGAILLLMFFLALPPLPGLPLSPRAEGTYVLINKNIIEMMALLALATTRSGVWFGLDALLQFISPFRRRAAAPVPERARVPAAV
jgi:uncharacterized membrane protein YphA (DoxX/SURF4 family)